ncbi:MAG TPA: hypothetical protein DCX07_10525 [Phycisphaerales bacterium]|nr:hypothetical protein [Phycisphaerales bacterium]
MKVDFHVHSSNRSPCGTSTEDEMIQAAIREGLQAIAFTDHNLLMPCEKLEELRKRYSPFIILGGIEISFGMEHIVVLGIQDKKLESHKWRYPELHAFCRKHRGFIFLAHPYRFNPTVEVDIFKHPPDAVEVYSANINPNTKPLIDELAAKLDVPKLSNSDGHRADLMGKYYNILDNTTDSESRIFSMLRKGKFVRAALDR